MPNTKANESMMMLGWIFLASMPACGNGMQLASTHKGAVALAVQSNVSSSSSTTSGTCTCEFTADNDVDLVYVQESSLSYSNGADWQAISTLTFACDSHTLLAVKAYDSDAGCAGGGFAMKCTSTDPASPWHYLAADQSWKAYGSTCTDGQNSWPCPSSAEGDTAMYTSTPGGWYNQVFDDSAWGAADVAGPWVADKVGTPISICDSAGAGWLFRSPYLAASWFVLQFAPPSGTGFCVSAFGRCGLQGCDGHAMSDLQLLNCDPSDPYQLFKFEAGRLVSAAAGYRCVKTSSPAYNDNCAPYTLAACDWTDTDQEFEKQTFEGATIWKAAGRYLDANNGNNVFQNEVWACLNGPNFAQKFEPMVAQEYILTRRSKPDPARSVCGDLGSLAMPKTDAERDALTQDLATYSGVPGYAFLAGKYLNSKWVWDDGTDIDIKGSDFLNNGANEPYLCISTSGSDIGVFHDCGDQWYPAVCDTGNAYSVPTESPTLSPAASPTSSPTVSPTTASPTMSPAVEVTALGDPHIKNVQGQRFDLHQPGDYVLVQIPKSEKVGMLVEHPLLRIDAHAKQVGGACGPLYLDAVRFRGMWASSGSKNGHGFYVEVDKIKAVASHPQHKQRFHFGPGIRAVLSHALTDTGVAYINLRVSDLSKAGVPIGGLLGEDDQGVPANAPSDCREQASLLSLEHDAA